MRQRSLIKKWIGLVTVLFGLSLVLTACQTAASTSDKGSTIITPSSNTVETTVKSDYLSAYGLAQKVAEAINNAEQTAAIYQAIPDRQRPEIMLDDFVQYISLLRRGVTGTIAELARIGPDELSAMTQDLRYGADLQHIGFRFYFKAVGRISESIVFVMQQAEDGLPYLDRRPLAKALAIQNFSTLYFDAIDRYDRDALSVLVSSEADTRAHRLLKADRVLSFYRSEIVTSSSSFRVERLMPDRIIFAQQIHVNPEKTQTGTRLITFLAQGESGFTIDDSIPDELALEDLKVLYQDKAVFDISKPTRSTLPQITSSQVTGLLGAPLVHDDTTCVPDEGTNRKMKAYYNGLLIEGVGRCDRHQFWRIDMTSATLTSRTLSLGSGIAVGDSIESLLLSYPFLDETDYTIGRILGDYRITIRFATVNRQIQQILLTVADS